MITLENDLEQCIAHLSHEFGKCTSFSKLPGDASNRKYFRLQFSELKTILMMIYEESGPIQGEISSETYIPPASQQFIEVQNFLRQENVRVPKILAQHNSPKMILLEDLGDDVLFNLLSDKPNVILSHYSKALEQLASLAQSSRNLYDTSFIKNRSFDAKLWQGEFEHFVECAVDNHTKITADHRDALVHEMQTMSQEFAQYPKHLCHRDYHARNLIYIPQEQQFAIIDFQDALMGPLTYDIASLLRDAYDEIEPALRYQLLDHAYDCSKDLGLLDKVSKDAFQLQFDLIGSHRNLKAAGRFFYIDKVKGNPSYLKDIPLCLKYVKETLQKYTELAPLKNLLMDPIDQLLQQKELYI